MQPQYERPQRLIKMANGVSVRATVKMPSGREVPVFTNRQLGVFKALVSSRFNHRQAAQQLGCEDSTVHKLLYGASSDERGIGVLRKLEMYHEQNREEI